MVRNILRAIYDNGLDAQPTAMGEVDAAANAEVALQVAREGIVLLANEDGILPLGAGVKRIAVIGGHADAGTMVGGGSSRVLGDEGPAFTMPFISDGNGPFAFMLDQYFNRSVPLAAIRAAAPQAAVRFRNGDYASEAARVAAEADVAIVFANQYQTEGFDLPDLSLPNFQDALISAVAKANPNTIVVLQTGGPVTMPWKDEVKAIVEAWYPGARGAEAIAEVLFGKVNPSGRLSISFPRSLDQLPRPQLDGLGTVEPNFIGGGTPGQKLEVDYNIEGSDLGYRWYAREELAPLFPFGHGLSYTTFSHEDLTILRDGDRLTARLTVRNTGERAGADVAQVYLANVAGKPLRRLAGFTKVALSAGEAKQIEIPLEWRTIAEWADGAWRIKAGEYEFVLARNALVNGVSDSIKLPSRQLND
jgi:beta-glucosidase